jgi:hypothetical protein
MRELRQCDVSVGVLELDEIHVAEYVLPIGVLVTVAFREGTRSCLGPVDEAHTRD